jgi:hypothetical protein
VGVVWTLGESRNSVVRANTGIMYDQTLNAIYEQALQNDGTNAPSRGDVLSPHTAGAPAFPNVLSAGAGRPAEHARGRSIPTCRSRATGRTTCSSSMQLERSYSVASARRTSRGNNLPVVTNINHINPIGTLPTGARSSAPRSTPHAMDPRYNVINMVQSIGEVHLQEHDVAAHAPCVNGIQFDLAYTLGKSEDNAPIRAAVGAGRRGPNGR